MLVPCGIIAGAVFLASPVDVVEVLRGGRVEGPQDQGSRTGCEKGSWMLRIDLEKVPGANGANDDTQRPKACPGGEAAAEAAKQDEGPTRELGVVEVVV